MILEGKGKGYHGMKIQTNSNVFDNQVEVGQKTNKVTRLKAIYGINDEKFFVSLKICVSQ